MIYIVLHFTEVENAWGKLNRWPIHAKSKYLDKDIYLVKDEYSIGRDVRNDIIVRNAECSRFHAVIKRSKKRKSLGIIDLKSSFGTYVNREKILSNYTVRIPDKSTIELAKDGLTFKVNLY